MEELTLPDTLEAFVEAEPSSGNAGDQPDGDAGEKKPDGDGDSTGGMENPGGGEADDGDGTDGAANPGGDNGDAGDGTGGTENSGGGEADDGNGTGGTENPGGENGGAGEADDGDGTANPGSGEADESNGTGGDGNPDSDNGGRTGNGTDGTENPADAGEGGAPESDTSSVAAVLTGGVVWKHLTALTAPAFMSLGTPAVLLTARADELDGADSMETFTSDGDSGNVTGTSGNGSSDWEKTPAPDSDGGENIDGAQKPEQKTEKVQIGDVTWESAPSYDGGLPGDYVFTAVLPEGYETAAGVELPRITVTVVEDSSQEEEIAPSYASMPADEVAPVTERAGTIGVKPASADNAGDRHKVRILWQTIKTVSKNATKTGCKKSWIGLRVPGMSGDQKYYFNKEMLTDSSGVYTLAEFTLPNTYENGQDMFPDKLGSYSALSLISGQFKGRVTLQVYDYVAQDWESYLIYEISPETALIGGILADKNWYTLEQPDTFIEYVDVDREDLYLKGSGRVEKSWDIVLMDNFGVVVTEQSKGWSCGWELQKEDETPYPAKYQMSLQGGMEGFKITAASGINAIPLEDSPWVRATFRGKRGVDSVLQIGVGINVQIFLVQYIDYQGVVYSEKIAAGSACRVADIGGVTLNQGRDIVSKKGYMFAGTYTGSDGKTYRPGDEIAALTEPLNFYMDWEPVSGEATLDGRIDLNGEATLTENGQYRMNLTYGEKSTENAPVPTQAPDRYRFAGWVGKVDGKTVLYFDEEGKPFNRWYGAENSVLTPRWVLSDIYYYLYPGKGAWCCIGGFVLKNPSAAGADVMAPALSTKGKSFPRTEEEVYRFGYELVGWFDEDGKTEYTDDTPLPLQDTDIYAHWKPKEVTLTLDANGGAFGSAQSTRQVQAYFDQKFGEITNMPPVPSRENYDFVGWGYAKNAKLADALKPDSVLKKTEAFTLYAIWARNDIAIYLDPDGGSFDDPADARVKGSAGATRELPVPKRKGYSLKGWKDAAGEETAGSSYQVPEDAKDSLTLTAVWEPKRYDVAFMGNNGTGNPMTQTLIYDLSAALFSNRFTRKGYSFTGWNTKADGTGTAYADRAVVKNLLTDSGTFTLYAQWKPATFTVSFDPNDGAFTDSGDSSKTVTFGETYGKGGDLPEPKRDRYNFIGWFTEKEGGDPVGKSDTVEKTEAHTLYAHWEYAWFTLSFDLRGGAGSRDCAFGSMEGETKEGIKLPGSVPERAGWEFKGWSRTQGNTEPDTGYTAAEIQNGTVPKVKPESGTEKENHKVTLYAVWYSDTPVVDYSANPGGADDTVKNLPVTQKITGGRATVATDKPTRESYTFMGWALTPDGKPLYQGGETIYSAVSVTLYAVWQAGLADNAVEAQNPECKYFKDGKWQFDTLANAVTNVPESGEIIILKDVAGDSLTINRSFTLNLEGHRLTYNDRKLEVTGGIVTIKNGEIARGLEVSRNSEVTVDSMRLYRIHANAGGGNKIKLTIQGKTIFGGYNGDEGFVCVNSNTEVTVKYAEAYMNGEGPIFVIGSRIGVSSLTVEDGYFCRRSSGAEGTVVKAGNERSTLNLQAGYYAAFTSGDQPVTKYSGDSSDGDCIVNRTDLSGTNVGPRRSPYLGIESNNWFTPGNGSSSDSKPCWKIYKKNGSSSDVTESLLTNSHYTDDVARFELQKDASTSGSMTLDKPDQQAVMDLNSHKFSLTGGDGNMTLAELTLKNGVLDTTGGNVGNVTLGNGTMEGSATVWAKGKITLTNMTLAPGATFYVSAAQKSGFESSYVTPGVNFGGTELKQEGAAVTIGGVTYTPYVAKNAVPKVTFHSNYGSVGSSGVEQSEVKPQTIGSKFVLPTTTFTAPEGYTFDHWNTKADGTGKHITGDLVYHDRTVTNLYAVWRRNYVTVTFDKNGGAWKDESSLELDAAGKATRKVPYNKTLGALPNVSLTGYGFAGWYTAKTGGNLVNAQTTVTQNQTYYARWTPATGTKYTVIWQGKDITGSTKEFGREERFGQTNGNVKLAEASLIRSFDGYTYSGYTAAHSGSQNITTGTGADAGFTIQPDGSVTVTLNYTLNHKNVTVTAKKKDVTDAAASEGTPAGGVTIGLSAQGHVTAGGSNDAKTSMTTAAGTTGSAAAGTAVTYYKYGSNVTLTAQDLESTGYRFAGWSGHYTAAGRTLTFPMSDREVEVTALYEQKAYAVEKSLGHIEVDAGGEKVSASGSGSQTALPAAGVPHGYTYTLKLTAAEGYDLPDQIILRRGTGSETTLSAAQTASAASRPGAQASGTDSQMTGKAGQGTDTMERTADSGARAAAENQSYTCAADKKTGTVTVTDVTTSLAVSAEAEAKRYAVSFTGTNVTAVSSTGKPLTADSEGNDKVSHGSVFMVNLTAAEGYELPDTDSAGADGNGGVLTVTMGGQTLTQGTDYTYDAEDGSLYIAKITGDVTITATAAPAPSSYKVAYYQQDVDGAYGTEPYETEQFYDKKNQDIVTLLSETDDTLKPEYAKTYSGYAFDREAAGSALTGTVDAAGTLLLKVYYKRNEYQVSIADGYTWADGTSEAKTYRYGTAVELAVPEKTGYDAGWKGAYTDGTGSGGLGGLSEKVSFNMPAKDVAVTPEYRAQRVAVSEAGLENVRFMADTKLYGYYEQAYSAKIEPMTGYALPDAVTVKVGGETLTAGDFTYNPADGTVTIKAEKVTGTIEITASGVRQTKSAKVEFKDNETVDGKTILTADPAEAQVPSGEAFNARITVALAGAGYALPDPVEEPDSLTITMGARTLVYGTDYTYSSASGLIRVPDVVEDVTVTASPTIEQQKADYQTEHYKENLDGTYTMAQRVRKEGVVGKTVAAGTAEALLKNYTGYTYDSTISGTEDSAEVKEDGSTVLKLYYRRNTCTLTLSTEAGITVEVQGRAQGGASGTTETVQPENQKAIAYKYGESVDVRVSGTAAGNSFTGWYQAGEEKGQSTSYSLVMTEDLALTAKSGETRYELVVNGNHGTSDLEEDWEDEIAYGTAKEVALTPDTGYHLPENVSLFVDGEEAQADACTYTKESETAGTVSLTVTGDSEIVFKAEPNHYKLLLDANGGKVEADGTGEAQGQAEREAVYDAAYGTLPGAGRAGYTFLGWFTEKEQEGGEAVTAESVHRTDGDSTVYARWEANRYQLTLDADGGTVEPDGTGGGKEQIEKEVVYDAAYGNLPEPERTGYTFKGWYTKQDGQEDQITAETVVKRIQDHTLYAYWRDETAPERPVLQEGITLPENWTNTQDRIPLSLYDGVGVTELWVSVDGGDYTRVDGFIGGVGGTDHVHTAPEGEHTYQFKAKDAAGNESEESETFRIRLDRAKPVIGTPAYENKAASLWQWIIGKKSMIVHVPVTDEGSGVEQISYTLTPAQDSKEKSGATKTGTAKVKNGTAQITFEEDFKGSIAITCTDRAGNAADGVSIGTAGTGGVIVEDRAPKISTDAEESYRGKAKDIHVTVKDDAAHAVTAGLASVTWRIGEEEEQAVAVDKDSLQPETAFTIPGAKLSTGMNLIRIRAVDNAGNEADREVSVQVQKIPEKPKPAPKPESKPDHPEEPVTEADDPDPSPEPLVSSNSIQPEPPKPADTEQPSMIAIENVRLKPGTAQEKEAEGVEAAQDETGTDTISGNDTVSGNDVGQPQAPGKEKKPPENMAGPKRAGKCRLCHMCPTFLGICYFIWLLLIVVAVLVVIWLLRRRKKEEEKPESGAVIR